VLPAMSWSTSSQATQQPPVWGRKCDRKSRSAMSCSSITGRAGHSCDVHLPAMSCSSCPTSLAWDRKSDRTSRSAAERGGNNFKYFKDFRTENCSNQGQNLALTGLVVPFRGLLPCLRRPGLGVIDGSRGTTRAQHAQGAPTQRHVSPSTPVYEEKVSDRRIRSRPQRMAQGYLAQKKLLPPRYLQ